MAKKIHLSNLEKNEKKKLGKVSFVTIFSVFIACVIMVGCFACSQNTVTQPNKEQQATMDKIYWTNEVVDTKWTASANSKNNFLDGQDEALDLEFAAEDNGTIYAYFSLSDVAVYTGVLALESSEGSIDFVDEEKKWDVKFSEKNDVRYLTISCGNGDVYYTSKK